MTATDAPLTIFVGTSAATRAAVVAHLDQFPQRTTIDASADPDLALTLPPPLLPGTHTHVANLQTLPDNALAAWAKNAEGQSVSGHAEKLSAAARRALASRATIADTDPKRGKDTETAISDYAAHLGITLSRTSIGHLAKRNTLDRTYTLLGALGRAHITHPSDELIRDLSSHDPDAALPWLLTSALDSGQYARAVADAQRAEAIPTIAYLYKRAVAALLLAEGTPAHELPDVLPGITDAARRDAEQLRAKTTPAELGTLVRNLAHLDMRARTGRGDNATIVALHAWHQPGIPLPGTA